MAEITIQREPEQVVRTVAGPWRSPALAVAAVAVVTRLIALAGLLAGRAMLLRPGDNVGAAMVNAMAHTYDAAWYDLIVQQGYGPTTVQHPLAAFLPGYPALVAAVYQPVLFATGWFVHGSQLAWLADRWLLPLSSFLVCNVSVALALVLLWKLYEPRLGGTATAIGLGLLLAWPSSFFLSAGYSEASFLAAVAGSLLLAERGRWAWAGALGAVACLIRLPGLFLAVPLFLVWIGSSHPRRWVSTLAGAAAFAAGAVGYHVYLWLTFGDPLLYLHLESSAWQRTMGGPVAALRGLAHEVKGATLWLLHRPGPRPDSVYPPTAFLEVASVAAGAVTVGLGWMRLRAWELVWVVAILGVPLATGTTIGLNRFLLVAFPVFMLAGWWLRRWPVAAGAAMALMSVLVFVEAREFARVLPVG